MEVFAQFIELKCFAYVVKLFTNNSKIFILNFKKICFTFTLSIVKFSTGLNPFETFLHKIISVFCVSQLENADYIFLRANWKHIPNLSLISWKLFFIYLSFSGSVVKNFRFIEIIDATRKPRFIRKINGVFNRFKVNHYNESFHKAQKVISSE